MVRKDTRVRVIAASYRRGFTSTDHFLRDADLFPLVGRVFESESAARKAADDIAAENLPAGMTFVPTSLTFAETLVPTWDEVWGCIQEAGRKPGRCITGWPTETGYARALYLHNGRYCLTVGDDEASSGERLVVIR